MISWYPVMLVLKQTSPTRRPAAPSPFPQKTLPSARTSAAVEPGGRVGTIMPWAGSFCSRAKRRPRKPPRRSPCDVRIETVR